MLFNVVVIDTPVILDSLESPRRQLVDAKPPGMTGPAPEINADSSVRRDEHANPCPPRGIGDVSLRSVRAVVDGRYV